MKRAARRRRRHSESPLPLMTLSTSAGQQSHPSSVGPSITTAIVHGAPELMAVSSSEEDLFTDDEDPLYENVSGDVESAEPIYASVDEDEDVGVSDAGVESVLAGSSPPLDPVPDAIPEEVFEFVRQHNRVHSEPAVGCPSGFLQVLDSVLHSRSCGCGSAFGKAEPISQL